MKPRNMCRVQGRRNRKSGKKWKRRNRMEVEARKAGKTGVDKVEEISGERTKEEGGNAG